LSGTITGTPTTAGTYPFTVAVGDTSERFTSKQFTLTVKAKRHHDHHVVDSEWHHGCRLLAAVRCHCGSPPYVWSVSAGNLPAGLTLAPDGSLTNAHDN